MNSLTTCSGRQPMKSPDLRGLRRSPIVSARYTFSQKPMKSPDLRGLRLDCLESIKTPRHATNEEPRSQGIATMMVTGVSKEILVSTNEEPRSQGIATARFARISIPPPQQTNEEPRSQGIATKYISPDFSWQFSKPMKSPDLRGLRR